MQERCGRIEARARMKRDLVCSVMERADLKKVIEPDLTVSLRPARPPLAVVDEDLVPEAFWKPQLPKLDRQGLVAALSAGRDFPGAFLGNPPMTISVRTIEGWHAIAEVNRIFGYDAWDRQTIAVEPVWEGFKRNRSACSYIARVRV